MGPEKRPKEEAQTFSRRPQEDRGCSEGALGEVEGAPAAVSARPVQFNIFFL